MGLFSFVGNLFGAGSQKKAASKATQQMVDAYNRGIDIQNQQYQQTRSDYLPYTQAGNAAIGQLSDLVTGYRSDPDGLTARIKSDPLYESLYRNGEEALLQNAAATGGLRGGNTQRGLADFGADTLSTVYQQILGNLGGVAGMGLGATGSVAGFGANNADNVTSLVGSIGQARANNSLARGRINAQSWQSAGSFLDDAIGTVLGFIAPGINGITKGGTLATNGAARSVIQSNSSIF